MNLKEAQKIVRLNPQEIQSAIEQKILRHDGQKLSGKQIKQKSK